MSTERRTETIPEWKQTEVAAVAELVEHYESVGVVDIAGIPSQQLQAMRRNLHGVAELRVSRNTLLVRALDDVDEGVEALADYVTGHVGLIGTDANPFTLFQRLEESKTAAPINAGEVAPNDIVIHAGDTGMDPGPFVGELQTVGAAARIDEGSIKVTEDSTVLEAGETVSADLANVLAELEIEPKEVGLDLRAVFADGVVFEPADLELDVDAYRRDVASAVARGRTLALNGAIPTAATTPALLAMASGRAKSVAIQAGIEDPDVLPAIIGRADAQVRAIAGVIDDEDALPPTLQDLADQPAPATDEPTDDTQAEESSGDTQAEEPAADDAEASDDETDEDEDDDGGDALGAMFG